MLKNLLEDEKEFCHAEVELQNQKGGQYLLLLNGRGILFGDNSES
jgi:hypothetical protein